MLAMIRRPQMLLCLLLLTACTPEPTVTTVQLQGVDDPRVLSAYPGAGSGPVHRRHDRPFRHKRHWHGPRY